MPRRITLGLCLLAVIPVLFVSDPGQATRMLHRNLNGIVRISKRVFVGRCVSVNADAIEFDNGGKLYYTEYTFEVSEGIKGDVGSTITFRQLGLRNPIQIDETRASLQRIPGMPMYRETEEYMLFLIGDSRLGLTSPVGLLQGAFTIRRDEYGAKIATNGFLNRGLFKDIESDALDRLNLSPSEKKLCAQTKGPFVLDDFSGIVKKLVSNSR